LCVQNCQLFLEEKPENLYKIDPVTSIKEEHLLGKAYRAANFLSREDKNVEETKRKHECFLTIH